MSKFLFILIGMMCILPLVVMTSNQEDNDDHDSHEHDEHDEDHYGDNVALAFGITTGAGMAALIGYCCIFCIKQQMIGLVPASLSFSSGVIIYLAFMNLIPESRELLSHAIGGESQALAHFYSFLCIIGGIIVSLILDSVFKKLGIHAHGETNKLDVNEVNDLVIATERKEKKTDLSYISYSVAFALILHHFPEGIATFISLYYDLNFGALVALALALHDIPSGICIAVTTFCATGSKVKPFLLCLIAALVYPFGAFIGWIVIKTTSDVFIDVFIGILFGVTGGIMLYIAFIELLPSAILAAAKHQNCMHSKVWTVTLSLVFAGFMIMDISSILLKETGGHSH